MSAQFYWSLLASLFLPAAVMAQPQSESPSTDRAAVASWADVAFGTPRFVPSAGAPRDGLTVLRQSHKVLVNRTVWDTPLTLGDKPFAHARHTNRSNVPLSFVYGGQTADTLLPGWERAQKNEAIPSGARQTISYRDPKTGLLVEIEVTRYGDAAALDWVCCLSNTGTADTPMIEDLLPLDAVLLAQPRRLGLRPDPVESSLGLRPEPTESRLGLRPDPVGTESQPTDAVTLRWSSGDGCTESSFLPHDERLVPGSPREFAATSSDTTCLPFFNLQAADAGWIVAVGWTGRWKAGFWHEPSGAVRVSAGMSATRFRLKPGERVRTPRIVLLRYSGARLIDGHNAFRRLMLAHYVPLDGGTPAMPPVATNSVAGLWLRSARTKKPLGRLNEAGELALIPRATAMGCEAYWMDAYWFPQPWYQGNIGNWDPRADDFPRGLRALGDAAHQHGLKFVLWFAPLHVNPGTQWAREYPQFVHGGGESRGGVWKLGDPAARESLVGWLSDRHRQWAFDVYREDFGTGLPPEESDDRIGVAEMKHIDGFYWFWSELKRRNPGLLIDNCSGGGRRIDIESARLAYCLWRSDFNDVGEGLKDQAHWPKMGRADQVMVTGLSLYYPLHAGPVWDMRPYSFRSAMSPGIVIYTDTESPEFSAVLARQGIAELKTLRPLFLGDLYPLLPLTTSQADWYAYQLDRPDLGQGCVFVFRRPESPAAVREICLENIDPQARYSVSITGETYDHAQPILMSGRELARRQFQIAAQPGSALLQYRQER